MRLADKVWTIIISSPISDYTSVCVCVLFISCFEHAKLLPINLMTVRRVVAERLIADLADLFAPNHAAAACPRVTTGIPISVILLLPESLSEKNEH